MAKALVVLAEESLQLLSWLHRIQSEPVIIILIVTTLTLNNSDGCLNFILPNAINGYKLVLLICFQAFDHQPQALNKVSITQSN
jgi:hypothetical protein